jgi:hypothetical protein
MTTIPREGTTMKRLPLVAALCFTFFASSSALLAQSIPPIKAKALDESEVVLPKPGGQQFLILVLGFSHKSGENCTPWDKRLFADYGSDRHVTYYQLPILAGAPSFVRPMILHGMRKDVPAAQHSHFVPIYDREADWKKLVNFSGADDAYILVSGPDGHVLWQTHGLLSDSAYAELQAAVTKLAANPTKP